MNKILLVDDDKNALEALETLFDVEYKVLTAGGGDEAIKLSSEHQDLAVVVMDIRMPGTDGIQAARAIKKSLPKTNIILHTGFAGEYDEDEIDAKERPYDYVEKGGPTSRLTRAVRNAARRYAADQNLHELTKRAESSYGLIGRSEAMLRVFERIHQVAKHDSKVMITGETGTGKELTARAIHSASRRHNERFAIYSCSHRDNSDTNMTESALFGHNKGTFSGAQDKVGLFEYADRGTVFLDEIADLDLITQSKILRVIEYGEYSRLNCNDLRHTDVRIICATNKDLKQMVEQGTFREDLYYRLRGVPIHMPPLRERPGDIALLVERFKDKFTIECQSLPRFFDTEAMAVLESYGWPGNVRQLLETVDSLLVLSDSDVISAEDVRRHLEFAEKLEEPESELSLAEQVKAYRRRVIAETLDRTSGNISKAARILGVDRANLRKLIISEGIEYKQA